METPTQHPDRPVVCDIYCLQTTAQPYKNNIMLESNPQYSHLPPGRPPAGRNIVLSFGLVLRGTTEYSVVLRSTTEYHGVLRLRSLTAASTASREGGSGRPERVSAAVPGSLSAFVRITSCSRATRRTCMQSARNQHAVSMKSISNQYAISRFESDAPHVQAITC